MIGKTHTDIIIVSITGYTCNSCTMDIKGVLDLYCRGQFYVFLEGIHTCTTARGSTIID